MTELRALPGFARISDGRILIDVRLTPGADRDAVEGPRTLADGSVVLAARVRTAPEKGAANAALERLIAGRLSIPKGEVSIAYGATSRRKRVAVPLSSDISGLASKD